MEQRRAPQVTVEGGPGEQPAAAARDELTAGKRDEQRRRVPRPLLVALALLGVVWLAQSRPPAPPEVPEAERPVADEVDDGPAFVLQAEDLRFEAGRALLSVEMTRRTSDPLSVVGVSTIPGLSVRLVGDDGQDVALPLDVQEAGGGSQTTAGEGPSQLLLAEFTLASCSSLPPFGQPYRGGTLVKLQTAGPTGTGSAYVGARYPLVPRLTQGC